jgi:hypothetical protein
LGAASRFGLAAMQGRLARVVIESDDWGMYRAPEDTSAIHRWGKPTEWAFDRLETVPELNALYDVLRRRKDALGASPKFVANMITARPDFDAMKASNYATLALTPLREFPAELVQAWKLGLREGLFIPQYHGRLHFNAEQFLQDLQTDERSREIFAAGWHGGLSNLKESDWRLHSEYLHWRRGEEISRATLQAWIANGLKEFRDVFGFSSQSTIAPNYIFSPQVAALWAELGITCVQGCNMVMYKERQRSIRRNLPIGSTKYPGLIAISRNVKFEPARGRKDWMADAALRGAEFLFARKIPVVIDTHRINYVSALANAGIADLDRLLDGLASFNVRYLTSFELADAIRDNGPYTDFVTGEARSLTPVSNSRVKRLVRHYWR